MDDSTAIYIAATGFMPARLTLAREAAGLTKKELADRIDTTASAVSQFESESSRTRPSPDTVARLALALSVPPAFFAEPLDTPILQPDRCHFRRLRAATKTEQRRILARGNMLMLIADHLERMVKFPEVAITSLRRRIRTLEDIERLAERAREAWGLGLGPIADVVALLERYGVFVVEVQGHSPKMDAFSTWRDDRPVVFLATDKGAASRRRFDAAHELGHLLMHEETDVGNQNVEREADRFASAFLMPAASFSRECPRRLSWPHLRALKRRWKVSLAAIVRRAYDLGLITEATYRRAYVQINKYGWREREPDEPPMEHASLITRAIELLVRQGRSIEGIASELRLHVPYLEALLAGSRPSPTFSLGF